MNGIIKTDKGYMVYIKIQDGTETLGPYATESLAEKNFIESGKFLNGWSEDEAKKLLAYYEYSPIVSFELRRIK